MEHAQQRWPRMHSCWCRQPLDVYLTQIRVLHGLQGLHERLFKTLFRFEWPQRIKIQYEMLEDGTEVLASDVLQHLWCDLKPGADQERRNVLPHFGLEGFVA